MPDQLAVFKAMLTALCLTPGLLFCSYSHLWESWELVHRWHRVVFDLWQNGTLVTASDHVSVDEFIASKRQVYSHDRTRYPLYFADQASAPARIAPNFRTGTSATSALDAGMRLELEMGADLRTPTPEAVRRLVHTQLEHRDGRAITAALFAVAGSEDGALATVRLMISRQYTAHYMERCEADILTGMHGLEQFDSLALAAPMYDVRLFDACLRLADLSIGGRRREAALNDVASRRGSPEHALFLREWTELVARLDLPRYGAWGAGVVGAAIGKLRASAPRYRGDKGKIIDFLELSDFLSKLAQGRGSQLSMEVVPAKQSLLLMVATDREWRAVARVVESRGKRLSDYPVKGVAGWSVGEWDGMDLFVVRCEMGSIGVGGSAMAAVEAIDAIRPSMIMMPGIAFGLKRDEQSIGDLLVARIVRDYETVRLGENTIVERGGAFPASTELLSKARLAAKASPHIHFGEVICGGKLIDNERMIVSLRERFPAAIGGEMEGSGLAVAAHRKSVPFLLVKGIVDWGYEKADVAQDEVAEEAVRFCLALPKLIIF